MAQFNKNKFRTLKCTRLRFEPQKQVYQIGSDMKNPVQCDKIWQFIGLWATF